MTTNITVCQVMCCSACWLLLTKFPWMSFSANSFLQWVIKTFVLPITRKQNVPKRVGYAVADDGSISTGGKKTPVDVWCDELFIKIEEDIFLAIRLSQQIRDFRGLLPCILSIVQRQFSKRYTSIRGSILGDRLCEKGLVYMMKCVHQDLSEFICEPSYYDPGDARMILLTSMVKYLHDLEYPVWICVNFFLLLETNQNLGYVLSRILFGEKLISSSEI